MRNEAPAHSFDFMWNRIHWLPGLVRLHTSTIISIPTNRSAYIAARNHVDSIAAAESCQKPSDLATPDILCRSRCWVSLRLRLICYVSVVLNVFFAVAVGGLEMPSFLPLWMTVGFSYLALRSRAQCGRISIATPADCSLSRS